MARGITSVMPKGVKQRKILSAIIIVLSVMLISGFCLKQYVDAKLASKFDITSGEKLKANEKIDLEKYDIDKQTWKDLKDYRHILLLGVDTREGETDENCRSDANIIVSINKKTNEVRLISIMRDTYLDMDYNDSTMLDKLTHAHAYGGPINTIRTLNRNLDLNIYEYVRVNWSSVAEIIDALGGIEVNITEDNIDEMNKYIKDTNKSLHGDKTKIKKAGKQTLNGVQGVTFCRIRHVDGDNARAERMKEALGAIYKKVKVSDMSTLNSLVNSILPQVNTNMSSDSLVDLVYDYAKFDFGKNVALPYKWDGKTINSVSYVIPITLDSTVVELHKDLFGQEDYECSDKIMEISNRISADSGLY